MKITTTYLRQIIKEELAQTLNEYNEKGPIVLKKGIANYGEPGGLDELTPQRTMELDNELDRMIRDGLQSERRAMQIIDNYADEFDVSVPFGLALYAMAKAYNKSNPEVFQHFKDKIEGGKDKWRANDYLTIGGGDFNRKKLEELYPKLMKRFA